MFLGKQNYFSDRLIENPFEENENGKNNKFVLAEMKEKKRDAIIISRWKNELRTRFAYTLIQLDEWNIAWYNNNDTDPLRLFYYWWLAVQLIFSILDFQFLICLGLYFFSLLDRLCWISYTNNTVDSPIKRRFINLLYFICFSSVLFWFRFCWLFIIIFLTHCVSSVSPALQTSLR